MSHRLHAHAEAGLGDAAVCDAEHAGQAIAEALLAEFERVRDLLPPSHHVAASMSAQNKSLVREFVDAINAQDWPRVMSMLAPDFRRHSAAAGEPEVRSAKDLVTFLQAEFVTFPDATETVLDLVAEGDKVAARHHFRGTQSGPMGSFAPSGRVLSSNYLAIYRIENRRIAEAWAEWDNLYGLKQLGHQ